MGIISEAIPVVSEGRFETNQLDEKSEHSVDFSNVQFEDDDDDDNENAISVEKLKQQYMGSPEEPELQNLDKGKIVCSVLYY